MNESNRSSRSIALDIVLVLIVGANRQSTVSITDVWTLADGWVGRSSHGFIHTFILLRSVLMLWRMEFVLRCSSNRIDRSILSRSISQNLELLGEIVLDRNESNRNDSKSITELYVQWDAMQEWRNTTVVL